MVRAISWADELNPSLPLMDLGIDSLGWTEFATELNAHIPAHLHGQLSATSLYAMSLDSLFDHITSLWTDEAACAPAVTEHSGAQKPAAGLSGEAALLRPSVRVTSPPDAFLVDGRSAPFCVSRAEGAYVSDADGREYVDIAGGGGALLFGHNPAFIQERIVEMLTESAFALGFENELVGANARRFCELVGVDRVTFVNTGTEATTLASRLARLHRGRSRIVIFEGADHGDFDGFLGLPRPSTDFLGSATERAAPDACSPTSAGIPPAFVEDLAVLQYDADASLGYIAAHAEQIAAVFIDPVQLHGNLAAPPRAFLHALRKLTLDRGIVLVFDEIVSGLRVGVGGAQEHFGVRADLVTYGQALGGGMPVGAVGGVAQLMNGVDGGEWTFGDKSFPQATRTYFAGTFCKHPLSMAAVGAVLERIGEVGDALHSRLNAKARRLATEANRWWAAEGLALRVDVFGSIFKLGVPAALEAAFLGELHLQGVHAETGRACFLSAAHSDADVDRIVGALRDATEAARASGLRLPRVPVCVRAGVPLEARLPVSSLQHQLLVHQQLYPLSTAYNEPISVPLDARATAPMVRAALQCLVRRHAVLRTHYALGGSGPATALCQVILPEEGFVVPLVACTSRAEWRARLAAELHTPFDLFSQPPARAICLQAEGDASTAPSEALALTSARVPTSALVLIVHHVAADAVAMDILRRELARHCAALVAGRLPPAPAPPEMEYAEFALREHARSRDEDAVAWWAAKLAGAPALVGLPLDAPRPAVQATAAQHVDVHLGAELTAALVALCHVAGATVNSTLLAMWAELLRSLSGDDDVVVGLPHSMRHEAELRPIVGMFVNTLPVRLARSGGGGSVVESVRHAQREVGLALRHAHTPLASIVRACGVERSAAHSALFQTMFHVAAAVDDETDAPRWDETELGLPRGPPAEQVDEPTVKLDLEMELLHGADDIRGRLIYDAALYRPATVRRWVATFVHILRRAVERPHLPLETTPHMTLDTAPHLPLDTAPHLTLATTPNLPLATTPHLPLAGLAHADEAVDEAGQPEQLLARFNGTAAAFAEAESTCIHHLVQRQAAASPDAVALEWQGARMTYAQLVQCSRRVAVWLRAHGVLADRVVALQLHRSLEQVGMLEIASDCFWLLLIASDCTALSSR